MPNLEVNRSVAFRHCSFRAFDHLVDRKAKQVVHDWHMVPDHPAQQFKDGLVTSFSNNVPERYFDAAECHVSDPLKKPPAAHVAQVMDDAFDISRIGPDQE